MPTPATTIKTFTTRDSATAFLRKQGVTKDLYNDFISNVRGQLVINLTKLDQHLHPATELILNPEPLVVEVAPKPTRLKPEPVKAPTQPVTPKPTRLKPVAETKAPKSPYGSGLAGQIRELIVTTKMTNDEIFRHLNLDADKKTYPGWYRGQLARKAAK